MFEYCSLLLQENCIIIISFSIENPSEMYVGVAIFSEIHSGIPYCLDN